MPFSGSFISMRVGMIRQSSNVKRLSSSIQALVQLSRSWDGPILASRFMSWAISALRRACDLYPGSSPIGLLGEAYAAAGRFDEAHKVMEQLDQLTKERYVTPYVVAHIHAALGQRDE